MNTAKTYKTAYQLEIGESILIRIFKRETLRKAKKALYDHSQRYSKSLKWKVIGGGLLVRREK